MRKQGNRTPRISGRAVRTSIDRDGDPVCKYNRAKGVKPHPDRGATSPHPARHGWVIDWIWPGLAVLVIAIIVLVVLL